MKAIAMIVLFSLAACGSTEPGLGWRVRPECRFQAPMDWEALTQAVYAIQVINTDAGRELISEECDFLRELKHVSGAVMFGHGEKSVSIKTNEDGYNVSAVLAMKTHNWKEWYDMFRNVLGW